MISWGDAHACRRRMASELQADLELDLNRPIDVFSAIKQLGLVLAIRATGKVSRPVPAREADARGSCCTPGTRAPASATPPATSSATTSSATPPKSTWTSRRRAPSR